jgi:hypothetical protein
MEVACVSEANKNTKPLPISAAMNLAIQIRIVGKTIVITQTKNTC